MSRANFASLVAAALVCVPARSSAVDGPGVDLRALYETRIDRGRARVELRRWSFTRRGDVLEYHFAEPDITERWSRDRRANASYVRVFHRENTAVRYTSGDLFAFGVRADWLRLAHVVAPPPEDGFIAGKTARVLGREVQRYQRAFGSKRVEVAWLAELGIPAEVRIAAPGRPRVSVRLIELTTEPPPALELRQLRQIDVADFGDMERDPFVLRHHEDPLPAAAPTLAVSPAEPQPKAAAAVARGAAARHSHSH